MEAQKIRRPRWLPLSMYKNCFNDDTVHLGFKFRGNYYCITHRRGNGVEIPKKYLKMKEISKKTEYLKRCTTVPVVLHRTMMKLDEKFVISAMLSSALNKIITKDKKNDNTFEP